MNRHRSLWRSVQVIASKNTASDYATFARIIHTVIQLHQHVTLHQGGMGSVAQSSTIDIPADSSARQVHSRSISCRTGGIIDVCIRQCTSAIDILTNNTAFNINLYTSTHIGDIATSIDVLDDSFARCFNVHLGVTVY